MITNVLKLDQIWQFQHKDAKNSKFVVGTFHTHLFQFLPAKMFSPPFPPPPLIMLVQPLIIVASCMWPCHIKRGTWVKKNRNQHFHVFWKNSFVNSCKAMLIQVMLSELIREPYQIPQHWLMGWGRIMIKARTSAFCWTMSCSIFYSSGKHRDG